MSAKNIDTGIDGNERGGLPLAGRVALVTGAATRIGRALALALAENGSAVVVHYLDSADEARETLARIKNYGVDAALVQGNLADENVAENLVNEAAANLGRPINILINNAAIFEQGSFLKATTDQLQRHQDINLKAPLLLAQSMIQSLPDGQVGDIININDYKAIKSDPQHFAYALSKVGLHELTRSLALAAAPAARVNELALGPVLAPKTIESDYVHTKREDIPCRQFGSLDDVASAMLFLLNSPIITGQTIYLDGGLHLK